ncbi:MAG: sulfotransferase [Gammaproteobacteria bacterium]
MSIRQAIDAYRRGDFSKADTLCKTILETQPDNGAAWELRGLAAWQDGREQDAVNFLNSAVQADPDNPSHLFNLGRFLCSTGRLADAASCLLRLLKLSPKDVEAMTLLGNVRLQQGDISTALETQQKAVALQPDNASLHNNLGLALIRKKHLSDAVSAFERAQKLATNKIEIVRNVAVYAEMSNDVSKSKSAVDYGLSKWPRDATLNLVNAKLLLRTGEPHEAMSITSRFEEFSDVAELDSAFAFEHANALELSGDYVAAFRKYESANQLAVARVTESGFVPSILLNNELIKALLDYYTGNLPTTHDTEIIDDYSDPVFIVGMPRSGTTLLDSVLGSGMNADVLEEEGTVFRLLAELNSAGLTYPAELEDMDDTLVRRLREVYFDAASRIIGHIPRQPLIDKMPFNLLHVGLLLRVFPNARFVRALRHPANVILSNFKQNYDEPHSVLLFSDLQSILDLSEKFQRLWDAQTSVITNRAITVRLEDLAADPKQTAEHVFEFLGAHGALLDEEVRRQHAHEKSARVTPNYSAIASPLDASKGSRWQNYSEQLAPYFVRITALAKEQGYGVEDA